MGARNQVKIPECIVSYICCICLSDDGKYTGYNNADGCVNVRDHELGNNGACNVCDDHDDTLNTSFEEVKDEKNPVYIAYDKSESGGFVF